MTQSARRRLLGNMAAQARELADDWSGRGFEGVSPDEAAQAAVCAAPILGSCRDEPAEAISWLEPQLALWERTALQHAVDLSTEYCVLGTEYSVPGTKSDHRPLSPSSPLPLPLSPYHLFDSFLHVHSRSRRKQHGVFFTPQPIAAYIVRQIDAVLERDFGGAAGFAPPKIQNPKSKVRFVDPACGTGVFLLAVLDAAYARCADHWSDLAADLLPWLIGIELLPAAAFLAKLNIALKLAETGYDFAHTAPLQIHCGDALDPELQSKIHNPQSKIPVLLGNPPFSSLSPNANPWITRLVRGDETVRGYVRAGDQRLGERKTWLHDDYVKFIRLAQWHVEQAGCGIVGFVTNRGYLENVTFRLMRQELLRVFPRIDLLDLHGSRKADEVSPGERDESVFELDQGVAIAILSRPTPRRSASEGVGQTFLSAVRYTELWGSREAKLAHLASDERQPAEVASFHPAPPSYVFTTHSPPALHPAYAAAWSLADAMPLNATAPVTARDHFVVALTVEELERRIEEFRDLTIPDDEIRRRYFQRTRSARYATGDTRGWQLAAARRAVAADADWRQKIVRCLYRPFDWRFVFWHPAMIDWPRTEVTRHLLFGECGMRNAECEFADRSDLPSLCIPHSALRTPLCLIARRQQPPLQPCTYFWIADGLALDGVIRSDNRGSESLFPLYLREPGGWRANFAAEFVGQFVAATRLTWLPLGCGDLERTFGPENLLGYLYGLFHAPAYRQRYAAALRTAFPRVLVPLAREQFRRLSLAGRELIDLHLLRGESHGGRSRHQGAISSAVANFRAGGYVALRKWLQPRQRSAADPQYAQITAAIERTLELMRLLDEAMEGGTSAGTAAERWSASASPPCGKSSP